MSVSSFAVNQFVKLYGYAERLGLMELPWFQGLFVRSYFLYKRFVEDSFFGLTKTYPEIFKNGHIIDVGSNIGYLSVTFAGQLATGKNFSSIGKLSIDSTIVNGTTVASHVIRSSHPTSGSAWIWPWKKSHVIRSSHVQPSAWKGNTV